MNIQWAPDYSTFVDLDKYPGATWQEDGFHGESGLIRAFGGGEDVQPKYGDLKDAGQWNLSDPNSPTWKFLAGGERGVARLQSSPQLLYNALNHVQATGPGFSGDHVQSYIDSVQRSLAGLNPQFVDQFASDAGQQYQGYLATRAPDGFSVGGTLSDIGDSFEGLAGDMVPFALASLGAYGGVNALGGGFGAASGGATAGGAAAGGEAAAGLESFLGPATGTVESAPVIGAAGAPTVSGVASGAGPFVPVFGGMTGPSSAVSQFLGPSASAGGTASTAGSVAGSSALARILRGEGVLEDYLSVGGSALPGIVGALASNKQAESLEALNREFMAVGAPSRARFESSFAPGFNMENEPGYKDALDNTTKSFLHKASISGNPAESPNAWTQTLKDVNSQFAFPALQQYRNQNAAAGGLSALTSAAPATAIGAINADANVFNSLGGAAADVFNPPRGLADLLREFRRTA